MKHKTLSVDVKDADQGVIQAVFSTFNVKDHDGDVTLPGAFQDGAEVRISQFNHSSWDGALPIGKGVIHSTDTNAVLDGQFFMGMQAARDTVTAIKGLGTLAEYSYGYDVLKGSKGMHEDEPVQFLESLKVHEVSPVLLGAGIGTHTVAVKDLQVLSDDELAEEAERAFKALTDRGIAIPDVLATAVRQADAAEAELKRRRDTVRGIALVHGLTHEGVPA